MQAYLDLLSHVLKHGRPRADRTGTGTLSVFGYQMRVDLRQGFPALTTKRLHLHSIIHELLWFIRGDTHVDYLKLHRVGIWDEWATAEKTERFGRMPGDLGPVYGHQWRNFGATLAPGGTYRNDGVDQLRQVIEQIRTDPHSRRLVVSSWHPGDAARVTLPPCHTLFQFYVQDGELSCHLYQRSADLFLGVPFNIASYALLTHLIAHTCDLRVGEFVHSFGDVHLYTNHVDQARLQLTREPRPLPQLHLTEGVPSVFDFAAGDIRICQYHPHDAIPAPIAV